MSLEIYGDIRYIQCKNTKHNRPDCQTTWLHVRCAQIILRFQNIATEEDDLIDETRLCLNELPLNWVHFCPRDVLGSFFPGPVPYLPCTHTIIHFSFFFSFSYLRFQSCIFHPALKWTTWNHLARSQSSLLTLACLWQIHFLYHKIVSSGGQSLWPQTRRIWLTECCFCIFRTLLPGGKT